MTFVITQPCIDTTDQACVEVCPVDCIHFEEGTDKMLYINPAECIDCGACQPACPVTAIFPEADVPAESQQFIAINANWYTDPVAARAQVGGAPAAPAAAAAAPAAAPAAAAESTASTSGATEAPPAAAAAPAAAAPSAVMVSRSSQVSALEDAHHGNSPIVPVYNLPSPFGFAMLLGIIAGFILIYMLPGPTLIHLPAYKFQLPIGPEFVSDGAVRAGNVFGTLLVLFFLGGFLQSQISEWSLFASSHDRTTNSWRHGYTIWRRGEESRRFDQERAVKALAETRFAFPTMDHPDYRTHVNVPNPELALEFGGGGGEKVYPDILVVQYPGNYPVMVAQVETGETVTREQAKRVWKQLESEEAPLFIYVPSGYGAVAKDYAKAAGIKHATIRTWARQPESVLVREV